MMDRAGATTPYVFLSYTSSERERVLAIVDALEAAGITVWVDRRNLVGGASWNASIVDAIRDCTVFALTCSARSLASPNVQQEVQLAWEEQRPILPLMLEPVPIPRELRYPLAGRQWVELFDRPEAVWLPEVLRALAGLGMPVGAVREPPVREPPPVATPRAMEPVQPGRDHGTSPTIPPAASVAIAGATDHVRSLGGSRTAPTGDASRLPTPLTSFIGREQELSDSAALLSRTRLLTLTGPGGTGKTRLALAAARQAAADYPDGAWFVDLSGVSDPAGVIPAIAQVLGVTESEGRSLAVSLAAYLRHKRLLLVLDNFEQVSESALQVHDLLVEAPTLTVLVTSRVLLRVAGEQEYPVPPLPLPDIGGAYLTENAAVQLFVERARALRPDFALTPETATAVSEICRRLDGLPLAIELAAARIKLLPPVALLSRLDHALPLLTGGARSLPQRQRTLHSTIAWSWDLLSEPEQILFRRLGVFAGGWTLEAAEAVCDPGGKLDVLGGVESLVDQSLVRQTEVNGEPRFTMLATLREFALEQLEARGEAESLRGRHAEFYAVFAERANTAWWRSGRVQQDLLRPLDPERDNLVAALQWAFKHYAAEIGLQVIEGASLWWYIRAPGEGRRWAEAMLSLPDAGQHGRARGIALLDAACYAWTQGDVQVTAQYAETAIPLLRVAEDLPWLSRGLAVLSFCLPSGEAVRATAAAEEAIAFARTTDERFTLVYAEGCAGVAYLNHVSNLGQARAHLEEALRLARELGADWGAMTVATFLGMVAELQGQRAEARQLWREARPLAEALDDRVYRSIICLQLALLESDEGAHAQAAEEWQRGLALARDLGSRTYTSVCLAGLAGVLTHQGGSEHGARLLAAVDGLWSTAELLGFERSWYDRAYQQALAATQAALSPEAFARAWAEGQALSLDQATELALAALDATASRAPETGGDADY